jgi:hypothetical protein
MEVMEVIAVHARTSTPEVLLHGSDHKQGLDDRSAGRGLPVLGRASGGPATEIEKARGPLESGAINQDEFERIKATALGS